jgi:hypothetical protein
VQRLPGEKFKAWVNLLCIASKHDGVLPPVADHAFLLRPMTEKSVWRYATSCMKGACLIRLRCLAAPQVTRHLGGQSGSTALRTPPRLRECSVTENASVTRTTVTTVTLMIVTTVTATGPRTRNKNRKIEGDGVTELIEVTDPQALAAWDNYGRAKTGKPHPRNRRNARMLPHEMAARP